MKTLLGNFGLCGLVKKYHLFINERRIKKNEKKNSLYPIKYLSYNYVILSPKILCIF